MSWAVRVWRVFPWDESAADGEPFTPSYVPPPTGRGRFDLGRAQSRVLYAAETGEHAVGEVLHPWRGASVGASHLERAGRPLALASVDIDGTGGEVADLCAPDLLASTEIAPDRVASRLRSVTQPIARSLWEQGYAGLRWWSRFWGEWHTWVLFVDRIPAGARFGEARPLTLRSPELLEAARLLRMTIRDG